jgi:hypothetical protein
MCIEADHRDLEAAFAMAAFISSMVTGFLRLPRNNPLSSFTERVAAMIENCPLSVSTNSIRSPASTPKAVRTGFGIVICPLEVTVAAVTDFLSFINIPYSIVRHHWAAVTFVLQRLPRKADQGSTLPVSYASRRETQTGIQ